MGTEKQEDAPMSPPLPNHLSHDDIPELEPLQFGKIQVRMAPNASEKEHWGDHSREGRFLIRAASKALMVFTLGRVQDETKALLKKLLERRGIAASSEQIVDDFIVNLLTRENVIYCSSLEDQSQLLVARPRWMATQETHIGYLIFNKLYITQFSDHFESVGHNTRGQVQLYMPVIMGFIHGWAQILAYNAMVNGLVLKDAEEAIRLALVETFWSGPDLTIDYLQFARDLTHSIFEGEAGFYKIHKRPHPAGWMLVKVQKRSGGFKLYRLSEDFMKHLVITGTWGDLGLNKYIGDAKEELFLFPTAANCAIGPWKTTEDSVGNEVGYWQYPQ
ncbi:hypothetical protein F4809DRAFT_642589 [Biscogniauxia mediterranea]|nr:hypothetical protein F4809DRAFT_642589 [Biscogniauxia mediterranea]